MSTPFSTSDKNPSVRSPMDIKDRFRRSPPPSLDLPASTSMPMSIRSNGPKSPPPPLPPPRFIDGLSENGPDPGWQAVNRHHDSDSTSAPVKSGSSLLGGSSRSIPKSYTGYQKHVDFSAGNGEEQNTNDTSDNAQSDQKIPDLAALLEYNKLSGEKALGLRSSERSSQAYDKQVLSRIGGPHTPPRSAGGHATSGVSEDPAGTPGTFKHASGQLRPLSVPDRRTSEPDVPRWSAGSGSMSALSPSLQALVSPLSDSLPSAKFMSKPTGFAAQEGRQRSDRETYDQVMFGESEPAAEDPSVHDLNLHDKSPTMQDASRSGLKRRAESPPTESIDPNLKGSMADWQSRIPGSATRPSYAARFHETQPGSLSSDASVASRNGSYASSYAMSLASNASTATSYSSNAPNPMSFQQQELKSPSGPPPFQRQLPSQQQNQQQVPQQNAQQQAPVTQPPQSYVSAPAPPIPSNRAPPIPHRRQASTQGMMRPPNVWICECCPKKPKKFESEDELRVHEMEKQYVCQYCHNRFKNKNEAERHQNSLHLRRHSWSCAAMQSFEDAFHSTVNSALATAAAAHAAVTSGNPQAYPHPAPTDTCSYCGVDFPNPADWDIRIEHLNHVHKFGECNQSKKFYRADHFRQHLKHSHAGTSGRWTNMLENACMREEMPPQPIGSVAPLAQLAMATSGPPLGGAAQQIQMQMQMQGLPHSPSTPTIQNNLNSPMAIEQQHQQQQMQQHQQQLQQQQFQQQQSPDSSAGFNSMMPPPTPTIPSDTQDASSFAQTEKSVEIETSQ